MLSWLKVYTSLVDLVSPGTAEPCSDGYTCMLSWLKVYTSLVDSVSPGTAEPCSDGWSVLPHQTIIIIQDK